MTFEPNIKNGLIDTSLFFFKIRALYKLVLHVPLKQQRLTGRHFHGYFYNLFIFNLSLLNEFNMVLGEFISL